MFTSFSKYFSVAALLLCFTAAVQTGYAQDVLVSFNVAGPADWNVDPNWDPMFVPEAQYNEVALIGGGRSVFVADSPPVVGGIIMDSSTLEIRNGGNLIVAPGSSSAAGNVVMGQSVATNLFIRRGGSLTAENLTTGGGTATQLVLGETTGSGSSNLTVTGGSLNRITKVIGPDVNFSSSRGLTFGAAGTLVPVITGATHSAISVAGTATLSGTVRPEFTGGTPALGSSWNLVTAGQIAGAFNLDSSVAPEAPRGAGYYLSQSATTASLTYSNILILSVDRGAGGMKIENAIGNPISLDGYTITSPSGALGGSWNSLQDQNLSSWDEADNSSATRLTEFKTAGSTAVNAGSALSLGSPFTPATPSSFGERVGEDVAFQYSLPGGGTRAGIVEFTGAVNNLVLTIDPLTGEAAIQNQSPYFNVAIDGYSISSASGKLLTGNSAWNSLQDQGLTSWDQADNSDGNRITEFKTAGSTPLTGGGTVLDLGAPVTLASGALDVDDFNFEFSLNTGEIMEGIVQLGPLPTASATDGDYDDNGQVDGRDFLLWQRALGASADPSGSGADGNGNGVVDGADLTVWQNSYGDGVANSAANLSSVPEPSTFMAALLGLCCLGARRVKRESSIADGVA